MIDRAVLFIEIEFQYVNSRGPGGQNVNKRKTAVELRWSPHQSQVLSDFQKDRLLQRLEGKLTVEGEIVIKSDQFRSQDMNKSAALDQLYALITDSLKVQKKRRKTKPTFASKKRRVEGKKKVAEKKSNRRKIDY